MTKAHPLPRPPDELIHRVGWFLGHEDPYAVFDEHGLEQWELIKSLLPEGSSSAWAFSVFTHLSGEWSAWLAELHRVVEEDGILVVTIFGPGHTRFGDVPVGEDCNGMNILLPHTEWDKGGPFILLSEWWIRAHWGRAFEILQVRPGVPQGPPPLYGQGVVVMRRRPGSITIEELEAPEPGEPRELIAARHNIESLRKEVIHLGRENHIYATSHSWRWTEPLRALGRRVRRLRR